MPFLPIPAGVAFSRRVSAWCSGCLWLTYGSFYFSRNNLGVALPGIQAELGYTKSQLGTVLMALKLAYGAGQFINGQLAEHWQPRELLAIGLLASAALNVVFGWATALYFLTFVWACNGYVQALGWPPTMRVAANWFPALQRGRAIGIIGTGYQLCGALTFVVAGWAAEKFGWRGALYVPARARGGQRGAHAGLPEGCAARREHALEADRALGARPRADRSRANLAGDARQSRALARGGRALPARRLPLRLHRLGRDASEGSAERQRELAAFKYAVLPFGGIAGAYLSGWATDRFFGGRRAPVICGLLLAAGPAGARLRSRHPLGPGALGDHPVLHRLLHFRPAGAAGRHAAGGPGAARHGRGRGGLRELHGLHGRRRRRQTHRPARAGLRLADGRALLGRLRVRRRAGHRVPVEGGTASASCVERIERSALQHELRHCPHATLNHP